ncbi:MAG TPA: M48 family metalloprotease, partial [Isosphaeraceae bacterium]
MPIRVDCPSCFVTFRVEDAVAGKRGRCPECQTSIVVPIDDAETYGLVDAAPKAKALAVRPGRPSAPKEEKPRPAPAAGPAGPKRTATEILAGFRGEIAPVRPTLVYRLWIAIVAGIMLLLPALYVAMIAGVVVALGVYASHGPMVGRGAGGARGALLVFVGPLVAGAVVVAFLLKPLFAKPGRSSKSRTLDPSKEALLFAFVDGVCQSVGAPSPRRIEVDSRVNASARMAGGPLSIGGGLVLTVGLPLVAGLDLKQFAGVLAHEFGHFSQRAGMRLSVLIWSINGWFGRVVNERDEWDETLAAWSADENIYVIAIGALARLAVWLARRVLWVLMVVARLVSGFLSRQMEFDADRYEARMVGGATFAETMERVNGLILAQNAAFADLGTSWRERRLPDDLPRLVVAHYAKMPEEVRTLMARAIGDRRAGLFDTHPSDRDRIARARREESDGIFRLDGPATDLFRDFDALALAATFDHYRACLGRDVSRDQLYPVEEVLVGHEVAE